MPQCISYVTMVEKDSSLVYNAQMVNEQDQAGHNTDRRGRKK